MPTSRGVRRRSLRSNSATILVSMPSTRPITATCLATDVCWSNAQRHASFRLNTTQELWLCATPKDFIWLPSALRSVYTSSPSFTYTRQNQLLSIFAVAPPKSVRGNSCTVCTKGSTPSFIIIFPFCGACNRERLINFVSRSERRKSRVLIYPPHALLHKILTAERP